jgi:endonuclease YncB( thermonuclease family)
MALGFAVRPDSGLVRVMSRFGRMNAYRPPHRNRWRRGVAMALPWMFILCVAAGTMLPVRQWMRGLLPGWTDSPPAIDSQAARNAETVWRRAGSPELRHPVDVIRTVDGDTFEGRVHLSPDLNLTTRIRLRGIDSPELKASCPQELSMAEAATAALRGLLGEGDVRIFNIGPDKYPGRVVADVTTRRSGSAATAMIATGHARSYSGGHRSGWCANAVAR